MLFKGDTRGVHFGEHIVGRLLGISFMSLAELERWPLERNWGALRKAEVERHLSHYTVLPVNRELCRKWAEISFDARRQGRPIQTADAWVAATALYYRVPLITHNRDDYSMVRQLSVLSA